MKDKITWWKKYLIIALGVIVLISLIILGYNHFPIVRTIVNYGFLLLIIGVIFNNEELVIGLFSIIYLFIMVLVFTNLSMKRMKKDIEINQDKIYVMTEKFERLDTINSDSCDNLDSLKAFKKSYWVFSKIYVKKYMCNQTKTAFVGYGFLRTVWSMDYIMYLFEKTLLGRLITKESTKRERQNFYNSLGKWYYQEGKKARSVYYEDSMKLNIRKAN